ncbi:MAG TPA: hypothetical protein HA304_04970 [Methanosarcinales archaeon]|nr:hypothetical protein [Methanosarcinales archaeon]
MEMWDVRFDEMASAIMLIRLSDSTKREWNGGNGGFTPIYAKYYLFLPTLSQQEILSF